METEQKHNLQKEDEQNIKKIPTEDLFTVNSNRVDVKGGIIK